MNRLDTPYGVLTWEGVLNEATQVTITPPTGQVQTIPLGRLIAMTNGAITAYLP